MFSPQFVHSSLVLFYYIHKPYCCRVDHIRDTNLHILIRLLLTVMDKNSHIKLRHSFNCVLFYISLYKLKFYILVYFVSYFCALNFQKIDAFDIVWKHTRVQHTFSIINHPTNFSHLHFHKVFIILFGLNTKIDKFQPDW
jgi:hypothetical protein